MVQKVLFLVNTEREKSCQAVLLCWHNNLKTYAACLYLFATEPICLSRSIRIALLIKISTECPSQSNLRSESTSANAENPLSFATMAILLNSLR